MTTVPNVISGIGHGRLGISSGRRSFTDLMQEAGSVKDVAVEIRPGKVVENWSVDQGNAYAVLLRQEHDGRVLDVATVRTLLDTGLDRVESIAICRLVTNSFFYDPDVSQLLDPLIYDVGSDYYDGGTVPNQYYDQAPQLFINLGGVNPNSTVVSVTFGIFFATRSMVLPNLGPDRISGEGNFEVWA